MFMREISADKTEKTDYGIKKHDRKTCHNVQREAATRTENIEST